MDDESGESMEPVEEVVVHSVDILCQYACYSCHFSSYTNLNVNWFCDPCQL